MRRLSAFNLVSLILGFAFLYVPILFFQSAQARVRGRAR